MVSMKKGFPSVIESTDNLENVTVVRDVLMEMAEKDSAKEREAIETSLATNEPEAAVMRVKETLEENAISVNETLERIRLERERMREEMVSEKVVELKESWMESSVRSPLLSKTASDSSAVNEVFARTESAFLPFSPEIVRVSVEFTVRTLMSGVTPSTTTTSIDPRRVTVWSRVGQGRSFQPQVEMSRPVEDVYIDD